MLFILICYRATLCAGFMSCRLSQILRYPKATVAYFVCLIAQSRIAHLYQYFPKWKELNLFVIVDYFPMTAVVAINAIEQTHRFEFFNMFIYSSWV